ncbi:MAG: 4-hydroxy-tetrahydrodipicolinate synthase [Caulobacterales bacterium]
MKVTMFQGSIPALVTPFKNGEVDRDCFTSLLERQIKGGSSAVVPCGTTGESATLSLEEHEETVELCVEVARGRVPVIAGAGSNDTSAGIRLVRHAKKIGADAALVVAPYYNRPNQEGLYRHFSAIADAVQLPLFLYNVPSRTSCDIAPETVGRLAAHPNVIGIKDATGDLGRVALHRELCGPDFILLSGDDVTALGFNAHGGNGCISVTANVAPASFAELQAASLRGDYSAARALNDKLAPLHKALFTDPSPGPTKYALSRLGLCSEEIRSPLFPAADYSRKAVDRALAIAGLI